MIGQKGPKDSWVLQDSSEEMACRQGKGEAGG